jgi:histidyl-tRNA synthetase
VIVAGEDEIRENLLTLKDLATGTQEKLNFEMLLEKLS